MGFLNYWPLGLLILIPVIIILYLLKQKTEPHMFPSLFLWNETYRNMHSDTPWEKLKKSLLMVMQIITVLALIIALMSPFIRSRGTNSDHVIIVMDNSASMKTLYDGKETRLEVAKRDAVGYIERLAAGTSVSIIESNRNGILVLSDSSDKSLAIRKIKAIEPTNYAGSCEAGASMVRSMMTQWSSSQLVCYTDTALSSEYKAFSCTVFDVYDYSENAYIEYVGHGRNSDGTLTVLAKVTNDTGSTLDFDANLYGDGTIIAVSDRQSIPAKESAILYFENVDFTGNSVCVELNNVNDALPDDNRCYDIITEIKECETLLLTDKNLYLEKAIGLIDGIKITKSEDTASFKAITAGKKYDLYIFDGMVPDELPESGNLLFINAFDGVLCEKEKALDGSVVHTEDSKLTIYLNDYRFGVSKATAIKQPYWADRFLKVEKDGETYCLGAYGTHNGSSVCMIGLDFHDTDLPLKLEFPLLIYNIMNYCAGNGILQTNVINAGNTLRINPGQEELTVKRPGGDTSVLSVLTASYSDTGELGVYRLSRTRENINEQEYFAVNFPKSESTTLRSENSDTHDVVNVNARAAGTLSLRNIIIIVILVLLAAEWLVYLRGL
jgi:hypothetical protein